MSTENAPMDPMPSDTFARRLRRLRTERHLSQAALATRVSALLGGNLDPTTITRMEKAERVARLDEAVAIARALEVPLSLLAEQDPLSVNEEAVERCREQLRDALARQHEAKLDVERLQGSLKALLLENLSLERAMGLDDPDAVLPDRGAVLDARLAQNIDDRAEQRRG